MRSNDRLAKNSSMYGTVELTSFSVTRIVTWNHDLIGCIVFVLISVVFSQWPLYLDKNTSLAQIIFGNQLTIVIMLMLFWYQIFFFLPSCRMPMLDLLIHVTAANKISPAAHLLQVTDEEGRLLPHKPSTPIGRSSEFLFLSLPLVD